MRRFATLFVSFLFVFVAAVAYAQSDAEEKSTLVTFVEEQISSPSMQISLNGLKGTLSSNVELESITISDKQGVWLTIVEPKLVWNRTALLRGRLEIESLTAAKIDYPRNAIADESLPTPEATPFALPDLPVAIELEKLEIAEIDIGEPVFGTAARVSIAGRVELDDGAVDLDLSAKRLDTAGEFTAKATYGGDPAALDMNVSLSEPEGGIVASLLGLQDKPSVVLTVSGKGPVDDLDTTLAFDVDDKRIVDGNLELDRVDGVLQATARLNGPLADILPEDQGAFFGDESRIDADLAFQPDGRILIERVLVDSGATQLTANGATLADGFLASLNLDLRLQPAEGERVVIPSEGAETSLASARVNLTYDAERAGSFNAQVSAADVKTSGITIGGVDINANGTVTNAQDPAARSISFKMNGDVSVLQAADEALSKALGDRIALRANGDWQAGNPVRIQQATVTGQTLELAASGDLTLSQYVGQLKIDASNLQAFADIADRPALRGATDLGVNGTVEFISGAFDLKLDGTARRLEIGEPQLDPLLTGETTLSGGVARSENGLTFDGFRIVNDQLRATLDGNLKSESADLDVQARLADLDLVAPGNSGAVELVASVEGRAKPYAVKTTVTMADGNLSSREVSDLLLSFAGTSDLESVNGTLDASGSISGEPITLDGEISASAKQQAISGLKAVVGATRLSGDAKRAENGLIDADITIASRDIASAAALATLDASGAINGSVKLTSDGRNGQSGNADIKASGLRYDTYRIGTADIEAAFSNLFGTPKVDADIRATEIAAAGVGVTKLDGTIDTQGDTTNFDINAALRQNAARIAAKGSAVQASGRTRIELSALTVDSNITGARLQSPATFVLENGTVQISDTALAVGSGSIRVNGSAGKQLDLDIVLNNLPLNIANSIRPDLRAGGTLSGRAQVDGTASAPTANFSIDGSAITVAQLSDQGLQPLQVSANGRFADNTVTLQSASASNGQGIAIQASGRLPLQGSGLSISANGSAPLTIAQPFLASRGASISGNARFDVTATGSLANPQANGLVSVSNGSLTDPLSNLQLNGIGLMAGLNGDRLTIRTARAELSTGGSVEATGSVLLDSAMTADISIRLNSARYTDGETFITRASGQLRLTGGLAFDPLLSGIVNLEKTEIAVPETLAGSAELLDVKHVRPSAKTRQTLNRIERVTPRGRPNVRPSVLRLDITVDAPNQIFVRGRGLDAELGGRVRVTGPVTDVVPVGAFELRRGRLSIVGQRIDLDEGSIRLTGDLDPLLRFVARTRSDTVEAIITIEGRASDLDVSFSAVPELPEDEVLAQVIFGRSVGELSAVQIARLASIAAELTGGNSPGLVDQLRSGTGLDDLDVTTDSDGNAAVQAGKYLTDKVYLGVQAGSETKATINLDITDNITARGAVGTDGDSSIGIFLEKDY